MTESSPESRPLVDLSLVRFQKMLFLYNAVMNGWTVQKINDDEVSFTKDEEHRTISLGDFVTTNLHLG